MDPEVRTRILRPVCNENDPELSGELELKNENRSSELSRVAISCPGVVFPCNRLGQFRPDIVSADIT